VLRATSAGVPIIQEVVRTGKPQVSDLVIGQISRQPTVLLVYPVRNPEGAVVGVLALSLNVSRLQTLFSDIPLPEGSVVTLSDKASRVVARSRDAELYIGKLADPAPIAPRDVPRTQIRTGLDGVTRSYGNAVVERGPWLLSIGIPTSVATARAMPTYRRNLTIVTVAIAAVLLDDARRGHAARRGPADRRWRSLAAASHNRAEPRAHPAAGILHHDGRQPPQSPRGARSSG
jgi:hypothetical protein